MGSTTAIPREPQYLDIAAAAYSLMRAHDLWVYEARLHPCCALIKNTELFRRVVRDIGLSCVNYFWADREEYLDTCKLMTRVMGTHGLRHIISSKMILHFFCVSYDWGPVQFREEKARRRDDLLNALREQGG